MEYQATDDTRRLRANRKALQTICITCGRNFRFGEEVACCSTCGRFQHIACWEGNICPHTESRLPAGSPVPPLEGRVLAPPEAAHEPAPANQPAGDERFCHACGQIVKQAALRCRFCDAVFDRRLAAAEIPAALQKAAAGNAKSALICGLVGLVICAPVFASMAISSGNAALKVLDQYPLYDGPRGKARAGVVLGWIGWILLVLGLAIRFSRA